MYFQNNTKQTSNCQETFFKEKVFTGYQKNAILKMKKETSLMWISAKGKVHYYMTQNAKKRGNMPWVKIKTDIGIVLFYNQLIRMSVINPFRQDPIPHQLQLPMHGAHVTVLDGRKQIQNKINWGRLEGQTVDFEYNPEGLAQHWKFWSLPVRGAMLEKIRKELGLSPNYPFHLTVGRLD